MHYAQSSPVDKQSSEWSVLKKTCVPLFSILVVLMTASFGNLAQASDRTTILNFICSTYESARQVALEQSWERSESLPGDCRILFQLPFELRVAEILQIIEIVAVGDGRWTEADVYVENLGAPGDVPVVGDFNGDGIDDLGIFRAGMWRLDSDGDHELTAHDKVFELGNATDIPIAGDFDGDGIDEVGVYRRGTVQLEQEAMQTADAPRTDAPARQ